MRSCVFILLLIAAASAVAIQAPVDPASPSPSATTWVRTTKGWESLASLHAGTRAPAPKLHPFALAGIQALGSLLALVGLEEPKPPRE